ncbi:MAG: hypothetical protein IJ418_11685 [Clostridia bacterium]|nr:hypothetical protein [Clostridia bacterium]
MKNKILWTTLLMVCLMLPTLALAVTEGVVEAAEQVEIEAMEKSAEISYLPDESYYAGYGDWFPAWENAEEWVESEFDGECYYDVEQRPRMTAGESKRAEKLLSSYQAGEISYTGESILGKTENVIVGVYALNPEDYAGENAFVILPGPCMTDEQILAVIDAYDQLGLTFDPYALSAKNCARGGGVETNRFLTEEERARYQNLARLIEHGLLDVVHFDTDQAMQPKLDSRYFCGLPDFTIRPYRAATDEEFVAMLVDMGYRDMTGEVDYDAIEKESRKLLNERLGTALSMELDYVYNEGSYVPKLFGANGKVGYDWGAPGCRSYGASFRYTTPEGILVYVYTTFDWETKKLVEASAMHSKEGGGEPIPDDAPEITTQQIMAAIIEVQNTLGLEGVDWHQDLGEETWTNWGECLIVRGQVSEDEWMTIYIGKDDGKAHGLELSSGTLVEALPEGDMPVNG